MNTQNLEDESAFHARVDGVFAAIESAVDVGDADIDTETSGGILTLEFENRSKVIINRQTFNREIWVAAKSGGFHFRFDGTGWRDTRSDERIESLLARVIKEQGAIVMSITI
ncbi:MAG: iron donor protein CyaY [Burkholderiales bacterium]|nr:iron donor protein CyaY [Burkholderiales bacterium]